MPAAWRGFWQRILRPTSATARQAVLLAEEACRRTNYQSPDLLGALAAAKAETGEFAGAVTFAQRAHDRAAELGQSELAAELAQHLQSYRQNRPFRQ